MLKKDLKDIYPKKVSISLRENRTKNIPFTEYFTDFLTMVCPFLKKKTRNHIESPINK